MDIKEFIEHFAEQFDETPATAFTADTRYRELEEWSSLTALMVIGMVDEEYDVQLRGADIQGATTVADLFALVEKKAE